MVSPRDGTSNGIASALASTKFSPPTATDIRHSAVTMPAAILRDHAGAIDECGDTSLTMRARRLEGVNTAGAVRIAAGVLLSVASFNKHCAYDFGEPVTATVIWSQAISRSRCKRWSIHHSAGCHPAMIRTRIC